MSSRREIISNSRHVYFRSEAKLARRLTRIAALAGRHMTDEFVWTTENLDTDDTLRARHPSRRYHLQPMPTDVPSAAPMAATTSNPNIITAARRCQDSRRAAVGLRQCQERRAFRRATRLCFVHADRRKDNRDAAVVQADVVERLSHAPWFGGEHDIDQFRRAATSGRVRALRRSLAISRPGNRLRSTRSPR